MILTGGNSSMDINQNKLIMYHYQYFGKFLPKYCSSYIAFFIRTII